MEDLELMKADSKVVTSQQGGTSSFTYAPKLNVKGIKLRISVTVPGTTVTGTQPVSNAVSKVVVGGNTFDGAGLGLYSYVYLLRHATYAGAPDYKPADPTVVDEGTTYVGEYLIDVAFNKPTEITISWAGINAFSSTGGAQYNVGFSCVAIVTNEPVVAYTVKEVFLTSSTHSATIEEGWILSDTEMSALLTDQSPNLPNNVGMQAVESAYAALLGGLTAGVFGDTIEDPTTKVAAYIWRLPRGQVTFSTNGSSYMLVTFK